MTKISGFLGVKEIFLKNSHTKNPVVKGLDSVGATAFVRLFQSTN
jgi:hypothetical protein